MPGPPSQSAMSRLPSAGGWLVLFALAVLGAAARLRGHDIPNDVTVQAFVKPEGQTLRLLVRVPLLAMRDMDYPKRAGATNAELLDLARADSTLRDAATLWVADDVNIYEGDAKLAYPRVAEVRASLPSDRSFATYEEALAHVTGPRLPADTDLFWSQGMLDVLFEYRIQSDRSNFSFEPKLGRLGLRTLTVVRFMPPSGTARSFELLGDPGIVLLGGMDYVLFLCCLAMPFRRVGALAAVVTAFVVAHSITLIASAYSLAPDVLWFPPLVDLLIAASILYMALENIVSPQLQRRWIVTFAFGLAYGFAFSLALRQSLQFAGAHVVTSLVAFNVGVELAVLLVVAIAAPVFAILFRFLVAERLGTIVLSAFVVHTAWHWFSQRYSTLVRFRFQWPVIDAAFLALMMRWAMLAVILVGAYWVLSNLPSLKYEVRSQKQL
jgi:hypothetical protein